MRKAFRFESAPPARKQRGVVLFVALIFLVILTLIGIANLQVGIMEERMTGSFNDRNNLAFESAELALREAETYLNGVAVGPFNNTVRGLHTVYARGAEPSFWQNTFNWQQSGASDTYGSLQVATSKKISGTAEAPRYVIEELADVPKPGTSVQAGRPKDSTKVYRITARGVGGQATTVVILQSTFKR